ncbi:hypothetical protein FOPG_19501 [Fusarium oxysporum f. sp. conglutinans race 2 54008]|uniref:Uncharacterized protein n=1 Tax=Fusarium oxysporum f. sp. conglutinans race 2 54008 TaxID=1089457 RepID=X0HSS8_FUSOX|nr:hypothetical protein FOPG_19501 [Fusarium oxysporum f. sp. conglutinans race 2 54008]
MRRAPGLTLSYNIAYNVSFKMPSMPRTAQVSRRFIRA